MNTVSMYVLVNALLQMQSGIKLKKNRFA